MRPGARGPAARRWLAAVSLLGAVVVSVCATRLVLERPPADRALRSTLHSTVLGEERELAIYLPASYAREPGRSYPVIFVLDGESQHAQTAESASLLARLGVMPEVIVVGVPPRDGSGRQRDYTPPGMRQDADAAGGPEGRADRFLAFLRDELIPRVERDYRTRAPRMLAGNSRGGLFVVYSLLAAPALFDARFAFSPALWRDDGAMVARLGRFLASPSGVGGFVYLSLGDEENAKMTAAFKQAAALLEHGAPPTLRWRADLTRGGDHANNAALSTPIGLYAFFAKDCAAPLEN